MNDTLVNNKNSYNTVKAGLFIIQRKDLRCVALRPEVHIKWFGLRCNAGIENFYVASPSKSFYMHFRSQRNVNAAQILASYYKPALMRVKVMPSWVSGRFDHKEGDTRKMRVSWKVCRHPLASDKCTCAIATVHLMPHGSEHDIIIMTSMRPLYRP